MGTSAGPGEAVLLDVAPPVAILVLDPTRFHSEVVIRNGNAVRRNRGRTLRCKDLCFLVGVVGLLVFQYYVSSLKQGAWVSRTPDDEAQLDAIQGEDQTEHAAVRLAEQSA